MAVDPLSGAKAYLEAARAAQLAKGTQGADAIDFGQLVQSAVLEAERSVAAAEQQSLAVMAGRGDIVDVVTAIAAAETQLETVMAVRDQVIQAYQEILRMPI
jgi:flagellar hook-basal body complex protein FliE